MLHLAVLLVTGGYARFSYHKSVEVLRGDGSHWCSLPDLPEARLDQYRRYLDI